jgi:hypothetical protein
VVVVWAVFIGLANWRLSMYLLMAYMPFAGIAALITYPQTSIAAVLKDLLFVVPAYLGFGVAIARRGQPFQLGPLPPRWLGLFATVVAFQFIHAWLIAGFLVALIGLKLYLFYVPMCVIGFHLIGNARTLKRVLSLLCLIALVPTLVGITEAFLLYTGHADLVYAAYGSAAFAATQGFAGYQFASGLALVRVPSTFAFVAQYFFFETAMIGIGYAWWRWLDAGRSRWRWLGPTLCALFGLAAVSSGQKSVFLMVPLLVLLIVAFDASTRRGFVSLGLAAVAILVMTQLIGVQIGDAVSASAQIGLTEFQDYFLGYGQQLLATGWTGAGVGLFTSLAGRYAGLPDMVYYEAWFIKVLAELGVVGFISIVAVLVAVMVRAFSSHLRLSDGPWRSTSAALLAVLVWTTVYGTKGAPLDVDPLSVFFWLFAGIQARVAIMGLSDPNGAPQLPRPQPLT